MRFFRKLLIWQEAEAPERKYNHDLCFRFKRKSFTWGFGKNATSSPILKIHHEICFYSTLLLGKTTHTHTHTTPPPKKTTPHPHTNKWARSLQGQPLSISQPHGPSELVQTDVGLEITWPNTQPSSWVLHLWAKGYIWLMTLPLRRLSERGCTSSTPPLVQTHGKGVTSMQWFTRRWLVSGLKNTSSWDDGPGQIPSVLHVTVGLGLVT